MAEVEVSVRVDIELNGVRVPLVLDDDALQAIVAAVVTEKPEPLSPYMTVVEAADYLRCSRQRVDDLLSQRRLTRHKDGSRTLVSRAEIERHLHMGARRA
jgi:excisionase family DNA binding protein